MSSITARTSFSFPTQIRFGMGVVDELPAYLKQNEVGKALIVTDPVIANLDFFTKIQNTLKAASVPFEVYRGVSKNPVKSDVLKGVAEFHEQGCDTIVGIGGGAALDVARAVVLKAYHQRDLFDYDDLLDGWKYVTEAIPLFVTIPTTSGTGSEVGRSAVISEDDTKRKRVLFSPDLMADQVFADPELTMELPPEITAATGMDALTHNLEAFLVDSYHPMADGIALEGARLVYQNIEKACSQPDEVSRTHMMMGSMMGAVAFQKGLGIVHSLSHPLSTLLDVHHGLGNAVNLPYGLAFNQEGCQDKFDRIASFLGISSGYNLVTKIKELNAAIGIPSRLGTLGVKETHVPELVELALRDFCLPSNPRKAEVGDIESLYYSAI